jgi:phosphoribosylformylglycinamidine (FGAM) synthase-like amidotransferase family enzyme
MVPAHAHLERNRHGYSLHHGLQNARGNVLGLMPHPDRAFEEELGSADGATLFRSIFAAA